MNGLEFFTETVNQEAPIFTKVLQAIPADKLDYTPHPKSRTAYSLVSQLGSTADAMIQLLDTGKLYPAPTDKKPSLNEIIQSGKTGYEKLAKRLQTVDAKAWDEKKAQLVTPDGTVVWETTLSGMCWGLLHDAIHHRGQLSSYIRPMGGKVPSIYGPSGDDQGGM